MTTLDVLFTVLGVIAAGSAVLAVTTRHLVHSALWLVLTLGALAGCYLVLGAELVALVQLLVYVGAIVVLVLFALMLTRAPIGPSVHHDTGLAQRIASAAVGAGTVALLAGVLLPAFGGHLATVREGGTHGIARALFGVWVWPFELLSVLLLVSLVAALAMARMRTRVGASTAEPTVSSTRPEADPRAVEGSGSGADPEPAMSDAGSRP
ncbi:MAG TPA: NADH-quinone oxidoreductase subunit J [Segeticoccus sp.]|uniref:NADH-quinone oxidoreductase subunit J family protein n=1 Tax=Segeticoccus sp. TaxID=2706531 RepID=UPI002D7E9BBE|nr:NADH-quinone oxidoreductase subunit J [Segeticoccus sp.]HET8599840.1 NADH-quinone oxidoreductase subunit J [Segeticoccus sp.]